MAGNPGVAEAEEVDLDTGEEMLVASMYTKGSDMSLGGSARLMNFFLNFISTENAFLLNM